MSRQATIVTFCTFAGAMLGGVIGAFARALGAPPLTETITVLGGALVGAVIGFVNQELRRLHQIAADFLENL